MAGLAARAADLGEAAGGWIPSVGILRGPDGRVAEGGGLGHLKRQWGPIRMQGTGFIFMAERMPGCHGPLVNRPVGARPTDPDPTRLPRIGRILQLPIAG